MHESNTIKSITTHACPHCGGDVYIESQMVPPSVTSLFTADDVNDAKAECLTRLTTITIDAEKRDSVVKWINDPETIFGKEEVENIISSLLNSEN